jgi:hypothetical protein
VGWASVHGTVNRTRLFWSVAAVALLLIAAGVVVIVVTSSDDSSGTKSSEAADLQKVSFQEPKDPGPDPFTEPADVAGPKKVDVPKGQGPFGGTGSDLVCDRDLLIRSLKADPAKMRAWAETLGVRPTYKAVAKYIAKLHPVTLTRDTRVTNHSYVDGKVTAFQSILAAGTAVLVDDSGKPVARCRCGNPLTPPEPIKDATCEGCPANYHPPPPCVYPSDTTYYRRFYSRDSYTNEDYDLVFVRRFSGGTDFCYEPYPDPPTVTIIDVYTQPETTTTTTLPTTTTTVPTTTTPSQTTTEQQTTTQPPTHTRDDACPPGYTGFNCQPEHPATETSSEPPPAATPPSDGSGSSGGSG